MNYYLYQMIIEMIIEMILTNLSVLSKKVQNDTT